MVVFSYNPGKILDTLDEELILFLKENINVIIFNFDFSTKVYYANIYTTKKQIGIIPMKHLHLDYRQFLDYLIIDQIKALEVL